MIKIIDKKKCTGCSACKNACPAYAIQMISDNEGFLYPQVDESKCIGCNRCNQVCQFQNRYPAQYDLKKCFAAYNTDIEERLKSSSGGMFTLIAQRIINNGGVVCAAAFDEEFSVYHMIVNNSDDLHKLVGSKYVQSRIGNVYIEIEKYLKNDFEVLFVGTTCQTAGLRSFLGMEYEKLLCVDLICLGIPSPKVWKDYLKTFFAEEKIVGVNFKNKRRGWHQFSLEINTDKRKTCKNGRATHFFAGYFKQLYSRPSCSECLFKEGTRDSDITLSDCWGYKNIAPEMDDNLGLSCIICHSDKGLAMFECMKKDLCWKEINFGDILVHNNSYYESATFSEERERFWDEYDDTDKISLFNKYCKPMKKSRIKKIIGIIKKILCVGLYT